MSREIKSVIKGGLNEKGNFSVMSLLVAKESNQKMKNCSSRPFFFQKHGNFWSCEERIKIFGKKEGVRKEMHKKIMEEKRVWEIWKKK